MQWICVRTLFILYFPMKWFLWNFNIVSGIVTFGIKIDYIFDLWFYLLRFTHLQTPCSTVGNTFILLIYSWVIGVYIDSIYYLDIFLTYRKPLLKSDLLLLLLYQMGTQNTCRSETEWCDRFLWGRAHSDHYQ